MNLLRNKFFWQKFCLSAAALMFLLQPLLAYGQLGALGAVPISNPANPNDIVSNSIAKAQAVQIEAADGVNTACQVKEVAFGPIDHGKEIAFGGLSLIGGSSAEVANIEAKLVALEGFIKCREGVTLKLDAIKPINTLIAQRKLALQDNVDTAISNFKQRKEDLFVQSRIAKRGLWKGILASLLIKTTKLVSQRLVNTLTAKFKINDVMKYADAVASQVYTTQLIHDRATDGQEQLILRSLLTNPALRLQFNSAIYERAADALELNGQVFSARGMSADDPDLYLKLAKYGDPNTSVPYLKTAYENRADEMKTVGLASAQNEILLGSGLKAPRTCAGNVAEQKGIDQKWALANDKMQNRLALYQDLQKAYDSQYNALNDKEKQRLSDDLKKAQADYLKAAAELKNLPESFDSPVLTICEKIASPADSVNKGIDAAFKSFSKGLSDYNDNNLPFFMTFISDIGSNIASNLIFGGDLKSTLLAEGGNISQAINLGLNFADAQISQKNLENGVKFEYNTSAQGPSYFNLSWEILDIKDAAYVTIAGPGISDVRLDAKGRPIIGGNNNLPVVNKLGLSGTEIVQAPNGGAYALRVFNSKDQPLSNTGSVVIPKPESGLTSASTNNSPPSLTAQQRELCNSMGGESYSDQECMDNFFGGVKGAFVARPSESLRGYKTENLR